MNKKISTHFFSLTVLAALFLSACGTAQPATPISVATAPTLATAVTESTATSAPVDLVPSVTLNADYENAVSIEQQLILGSFKLEGTSLAITKEQAVILLPLYTNIQTIMTSAMPAQGNPGTQPQAISVETQAQIDAIVKDILATMTPEQTQAISTMQITRDIAQTIMSEQGITMGGPGQGTGQQGGMPAANGQSPQGTPLAGGPNGGAGVPDANGPQGGQPGGNMIPPELINALIQLLQTK